MGELMRRVLAARHALAGSCHSPTAIRIRMMLLGEKLIAFRDTNGHVGGDPEPLPPSWRIAVLWSQ